MDKQRRLLFIAVPVVNRGHRCVIFEWARVIGAALRDEEAPRAHRTSVSMAVWERPDFEHVPLGAEVTAYLGSAPQDDAQLP
jgi:coenzyme PQQ precursor peptide PqqA